MTIVLNNAFALTVACQENAFTRNVGGFDVMSACDLPCAYLAIAPSVTKATRVREDARRWLVASTHPNGHKPCF